MQDRTSELIGLLKERVLVLGPVGTPSRCDGASAGIEVSNAQIAEIIGAAREEACAPKQRGS